jgi:trehalose-6-phosphate synthase
LRFRLVCPPPEPGITAYDTTRRRLEDRVAEINRTWSDGDWQPIEYLPRPLSFGEIVEDYLAADVFWVTSLAEGMNLTAKEFVAAHAAAGLRGVLVISEHAGAAEELGLAAVLTDPRSVEDLTDKLEFALDLTDEERRTRLRTLSDLLGWHHPRNWAAAIISAIAARPRPATAEQARVPVAAGMA